ncbi:hypothetical protein SESBI_42239 [Sesbania bispinosa]|nr:hypothetical protein SESBI_42239 [Sesbania bispinosa]
MAQWFYDYRLAAMTWRSEAEQQDSGHLFNLVAAATLFTFLCFRRWSFFTLPTITRLHYPLPWSWWRGIQWLKLG